MAALNFCRKEWDEKRCPSRTKVDQKPWNPKAKVFLVKATWWIAQWIWRAKFFFGWSPGWLCTACVTRWKRASFTVKASPTKHIVCRSTLWKIWRGMPHARKRQPTYPQKQRIQDINSAYKFEVSARSRATIGWCTQNQAAGMSSQSRGLLMTACCWTLFMTERTSAEPRFPDPSLMFVSSLMLMLITWRMWGSCSLKFWGELDCKNKLHTAITNDRKYKNTARRLPLPTSALPSPWSGTSSTGFHFVLEDAKNSLWKLALAAWSASPSASSVFSTIVPTFVSEKSAVLLSWPWMSDFVAWASYYPHHLHSAPGKGRIMTWRCMPRSWRNVVQYGAKSVHNVIKCIVAGISNPLLKLQNKYMQGNMQSFGRMVGPCTVRPLLTW